MNDASTAAIKFALDTHTDGGMEFLRCWFHSDFESIRKEWPEAPEAVFVGADPLHEADERAKAILEMARDNYQRDGELEFDDNAVISEGEDNGAYVQGWRWVSFAGTELDKKKPVWVAGYNMPGYMPDNEPAEFDTFDEAKRYIIDEMLRFEAETDEAKAGFVDEEYITELEEKAATYRLGAEEVNLQSGEFSGQFGDYVFWVKEGE